jgi:hypothetical protein
MRLIDWSLTSDWTLLLLLLLLLLESWWRPHKSSPSWANCIPRRYDAPQTRNFIQELLHLQGLDTSFTLELLQFVLHFLQFAT